MAPEGRSHETEPAGEQVAERRPVIYCLIPYELAPKLHELLRDHFRERPGVEVVVERRGRERRRTPERRGAKAGAAREPERRRVHSASGRRMGERRAALRPAETPEEAEQTELALNWLTDRDLSILVEHLSPIQRQVLTLRYLLDLSTDDIAAAVERTPKAVRQIQSRALRQLEERLTALGRRGTSEVKRTPTLTRLKPMPVMVPRRFALTKGPPRPER